MATTRTLNGNDITAYFTDATGNRVVVGTLQGITITTDDPPVYEIGTPKSFSRGKRGSMWNQIDFEKWLRGTPDSNKEAKWLLKK